MTCVKRPGYKMRPMMRKLLRLAFVLLLAGSVPLQALAAQSIDVCKTMDHGDAQMQSAAGHGHASPGASIDDDQSPVDDTMHHAASCGAVAGIVGYAEAVVADVSSDGIHAAALPAPEGIVPDGLERPPLKSFV